MHRISLLSFFALCPLAFGQLDSNSITVTAIRGTSLQPDQVVFGVDVTAGLDTSLDDVVAALAGSGITMANFAGTGNGVIQGVFGPNPATTVQPTIDWAFTLAAPLSQMKSTVAMLTKVQQNIGSKNSGLTLSFSVRGTQVSAQLQQSQPCSVPDLVSDARAQALKIATAAGVSMGGIIGMSSVTTSSNASPIVAGNVLPSTCSLTVKFALVRLS